MNDKLTTKVDAELGRNIVAAAHEERRKRFTNNVVQRVDSIMEGIQVTERKVKFYTECLDKLKQQLAAIEAGEFTLGARGEMEFNDKSLTMPTPATMGDFVDHVMTVTQERSR